VEEFLGLAVEVTESAEKQVFFKNHAYKNLSFKKESVAKEKSYFRYNKEEREEELGYELDRIISVLRKDIKITLLRE